MGGLCTLYSAVYSGHGWWPWWPWVVAMVAMVAMGGHSALFYVEPCRMSMVAMAGGHGGHGWWPWLVAMAGDPGGGSK